MPDARKKTKEQIRKEIIAFLQSTCGLPDMRQGRHRCGTIHRTSLVLATSSNDAPRATPLEFFHEGLTIYIFGAPGKKIANIKRNPRVSAAIYQQPMVHTKTQRSLQFFGTAELITIRNKPKLFRAKARKWNMYGAAEKAVTLQTTGRDMSKKEKQQMTEKILGGMFLIKISPQHIIIREYHPDFSMPKYEWHA